LKVLPGSRLVREFVCHAIIAKTVGARMCVRASIDNLLRSQYAAS